jgi:hypothetical protein
MIIKPTITDIKSIGYYLGKIMLGFGLTMLIPAGPAPIMIIWYIVLTFLIFLLYDEETSQRF